MVKDLGKERKVQKRDIDMEYPKWPWVEYKFQDSKFFQEVWKFPIDRLDPKFDITNVIVNTIDIAKIFGNVQTFKTTNPLLSEENKKQLKKLYWKLYGLSHITNNKLYLWLVRGWIAKSKGHRVNWAKAVVVIAHEKVRRVSTSVIGKRCIC